MFLFFPLAMSKFYEFREIFSFPLNLQKIREIRTEEYLYEYFLDDNKLKAVYYQVNYPLLLEKIAKLPTPVVFEGHTMSVTIYPFDKVIVKEGDREYCTGYYKTSIKDRDENAIQVFTNGDRCDLNPKMKWKTKVFFNGRTKGKTRISSVIEKKLCQYNIVVEGEHFCERTKDKVAVCYYKTKLNN